MTAKVRPIRQTYPVTIDLTEAELVAIRDAAVVVTSNSHTREAELAIGKLKRAVAATRPRKERAADGGADAQSCWQLFPTTTARRSPQPARRRAPGRDDRPPGRPV